MIIRIAVLGYGVVGSGVTEVLDGHAALIEKRHGVALRVKSILETRPVDDSRVAANFDVIENDPEIFAVVESIGGCGAAYEFTKRALKAKKHVVTSNKELVAEHGAELLELARENGVFYLFEASVGGGIPLIHPLAQCLPANTFSDIVGILNGTSNYILTHMEQNGTSFEEALREAQKLGYAEADPSADVDGYDCARKICILADLVFGKHIPPGCVGVEGIRGITAVQLAEAGKAGYAVKLLGRAYRRDGELPRVHTAPYLVPKDHPLANVGDVFNGILFSGDVNGDVMFYGKGAGAKPTASSIISDILDCVNNKNPLGGLEWTGDAPDIAPPEAVSGYTFSDGTKMRILCF